MREDGQKVLSAVKTMAGGTSKARRAVPDDLVKRGLRKPQFLIVACPDDGRGRDWAGAVVGCPRGRCADPTLHRPQTPQPPGSPAQRLHDEVSADYNDMIYAASPTAIEARCRAFIQQTAAQMQGGRRRRRAGR